MANGWVAVPSVLVPGLDLGVGQTEFGGQFEPVLDAEVLLTLEALLQRLQLVVGEGGARLARLFAQRLVAVALAGRAAVVVAAVAAVAAAALDLVAVVVVLGCNQDMRTQSVSSVDHSRLVT